MCLHVPDTYKSTDMCVGEQAGPQNTSTNPETDKTADQPQSSNSSSVFACNPRPIHTSRFSACRDEIRTFLHYFRLCVCTSGKLEKAHGFPSCGFRTGCESDAPSCTGDPLVKSRTARRCRVSMKADMHTRRCGGQDLDGPSRVPPVPAAWRESGYSAAEVGLILDF